MESGVRFDVRVGGQRVKRRFHSAGGGVYVGTLRRGAELSRGLNQIYVWARAGGRTDFDFQPVVVARDARRFVTVRGALRGTRRNTPRVRVLTRDEPRRIVARLNGDRVRGDFVDVTGAATPESLGPEDGLEYGRNRLVVRAWHEDGRFDREVRNFVVRRTAPLAAITGPERAEAGQPVRLNGSRSVATTRKGRLRHRWRVVGGPNRFRLRRAQTGHPIFVPKVAGRYRLRLELSERGRDGKGRRLGAKGTGDGSGLIDIVTGPSPFDVPPLGVTISTMAADGGGPGVLIDGQLQYASGKGPPCTGLTDTQDPGMAQVVWVDRATLQVKCSQSFSPSQTTPFASAIGGAVCNGCPGSSLMVIVTGGGNPIDVNEDQWDIIKYAFGSLGGPQLPSAANDAPPAFKQGQWSLIGIPGLESGQAATSIGVLGGLCCPSPPRGSLEGYLQQDVNGNFSFVSPEAVPVDTNATNQNAPTGGQNVMAVGSQSLAAPQALDAGTSGFHLVVLDDGGLSVEENNVYVTNRNQQSDGSGGFTDTSQVSELNGLLGYLAQSPSNLNDQVILLQSVGTPTPRPDQGGTTPYAWLGAYEGPGPPEGGLAQTIRQLGGTKEVIQGLTSSVGTPVKGYALAALTHAQSGNAVEESPLVHNDSRTAGQPTQVVGTLTRNQQAQFTAVNSFAPPDPSQALDPQSTPQQIAYQAPTAWPLTDTQGHINAMVYIARQNGMKYVEDIRVNYWAGEPITGSERFPDYPGEGECGCTDQEYGDVVTQLQTEFADVVNVQTWIGQIQEVFQNAAILNTNDVEQAVGQIMSTIGSGSSSDFSNAEEVLGLLVGLADLALPAAEAFGAGGALEAVGGGLQLAEAAATSQTGNPLLGRIQAEASALGNSLADSFTAANESLDQLHDLLVSDWGKLQVAAQLSNGQWAISDKSDSAMSNALTDSNDIFLYTGLMGSVFYQYRLGPGGDLNGINGIDPYAYQCYQQGDGGGSFHPWNGEPGAGWYWQTEEIDSGGTTRNARALGTYIEFVVANNEQVAENHPDYPSAQLVNTLFSDAAQGGYGLTQMQFFNNNLPFIDVYCS